MVVEMSSGRAVAAGEEVSLPGRLGDPQRTLGTDPRADPRMVAALAAFGLDQRGEPPPVTPSSPRDEQLAYCAAAEAGFEALFGALYAGLPAMDGVTSVTVTIAGDAGHDIRLYVHRPAGATGTLPCIVHLHGGGMVILEAAGAAYQRWRDELAAMGMVVVGVEYRNGAGQLGVHPFPSGLDDCAAALRWVSDHRDELGVDKVVVSGESGGGNLTLAVDPAGQAGRLGRGHRGCLRAVPVHLERVGDEAGHARVAARERRLLPGLRRDGGDGRGLRPGRSPRRRPDLLAVPGHCGRSRGPAAARHLGQRARSSARRGPRLLPPARGRRCQRGQPDGERHLPRG